jgi:hypothetical protein
LEAAPGIAPEPLFIEEVSGGRSDAFPASSRGAEALEFAREFEALEIQARLGELDGDPGQHISVAGLLFSARNDGNQSAGLGVTGDRTLFARLTLSKW